MREVAYIKLKTPLRIWIKNNRGLKKGPCGTPGLIFFQGNFRPFNSTLCFQYFIKKRLETFKRFLDISFRQLNFRIIRSGQNLLIYLKTLPFPLDYYQKIDIFCRRWKRFMTTSPGSKTNWFDDSTSSLEDLTADRQQNNMRCLSFSFFCRGLEPHRHFLLISQET